MANLRCSERAKREERLESLHKALLKAKFVVLDERGYAPFDIEGARLLFQVIADCYERKSMNIITNVEFEE